MKFISFWCFLIIMTGQIKLFAQPIQSTIYFDFVTLNSDNISCGNQVEDFSVSPNGERLAIYDRFVNVIRIFNISDFSLIDTIQIQQDYVTTMIFSTNGDRIIWGASDEGIDSHYFNGSLYIYDVHSESILTTIENIADIVDKIIFFDNSENLILRGLYPGYEKEDIQVWNVYTQELISKKEKWHIVATSSIEGESIFIGSTSSLGITNEFSYELQIWDIFTDTISETREIYTPITTVTMREDSKLLISGDAEGYITIWDIDTLTDLRSFSSNVSPIIDLVFVEPHILLIIGKDRTTTQLYASVWNIETEQSQFLTGTILSNGKIGVHPFEPAIFVLQEIDGITELVLWNYDLDTSIIMNMKCE